MKSIVVWHWVIGFEVCILGYKWILDNYIVLVGYEIWSITSEITVSPLQVADLSNKKLDII